MHLGERQFTDDTTRPVYRSDDGRQYVLDDDGEPVYGVWQHPDEHRAARVVTRSPKSTLNASPQSGVEYSQAVGSSYPIGPSFVRRSVFHADRKTGLPT